MLKKESVHTQLNFLAPTLKEQLNPSHGLYKLSHQIDWGVFESLFGKYYSAVGRPAKPIRLMVSLLILKQVENLSDEVLVLKWSENPYYQYFGGVLHFQWEAPCDASDLVHFRNRIGTDGIEQIFKMSVSIQGKDAQEDKLSIDSTAQEKNITYPTDVKLQVRIIEKCRKIAKLQGVDLRQSYLRTVKEHLINQRFRQHPKNKKKALSSARKIKTIAWRLVRELERKLANGAYRVDLDLFKRVLNQQKEDKNKIYSLHELEVACIAKGKEHKKFEFGSKVSIAITRTTNVIVSVVTFKGNPHDSKTLEQTLECYQRIVGKQAKEVAVDRGYRGKTMVGDTKIYAPTKPKASDSDYQKRVQRKRFRRRAAIEPIIGHTKADHRMARCFLKGFKGDERNAIMAAAGFNFKRWIRKAISWLNFYLLLIVQYSKITEPNRCPNLVLL
jgi:IS5 family transposase